MWDLVPWPGIIPRPPALGAQNLSPGPPRKSLDRQILMQALLKPKTSPSQPPRPHHPLPFEHFLRFFSTTPQIMDWKLQSWWQKYLYVFHHLWFSFELDFMASGQDNSLKLSEMGEGGRSRFYKNDFQDLISELRWCLENWLNASGEGGKDWLLPSWEWTQGESWSRSPLSTTHWHLPWVLAIYLYKDWIRCCSCWVSTPPERSSGWRAETRHSVLW